MSLSRRNFIRTGIGFGSGLALVSAGIRPAFTQDSPMPNAENVTAANGEITVHPIEHASLALTGGGMSIYADPVGDPGLYQGLNPANLILVTHEHADHYNAERLKALMGDNGALVVNPAVHAMLPADLKATATVLANGETATVAGIEIAAIPAYNTTPERQRYHPQGRDNGYVFTLNGVRTYIAGDTEDTPEMRALTGIDLAFIPMNLPYTMDETQAASGIAAFAPATVFPYHYRGSDLEKLKSLVAAANSAINVRLANWY